MSADSRDSLATRPNADSGGPRTLSGGSRPGVVSLALKDHAGLYAAYMPFLKNGGIFVPSTRPYRLGEEVFLVLSLFDRPQKYQVAGRVAWITPVGLANKTPGIGVHLSDDEHGRALRRTIEELMGNNLNAQRPTQTL